MVERRGLEERRPSGDNGTWIRYEEIYDGAENEVFRDGQGCSVCQIIAEHELENTLFCNLVNSSGRTAVHRVLNGHQILMVGSSLLASSSVA